MPETVRELVSASLGRVPLSLKIENSRVLNVFSGEILQADIVIYGDTIVFVGDASRFQAEKTFDARQMVAIPGLIDTHLHIESTMLTPANFANAVLPFGTTTVFADPHEIVNVLGKKGLKMNAGKCSRIFDEDLFLHSNMRSRIRCGYLGSGNHSRRYRRNSWMGRSFWPWGSHGF